MAMVACILCLQEEDASAKPSARHIEIFAATSSKMQMSEIISKHFWLKLDAAEHPKASICRACWKILHEFHCFYERIVSAHDVLKSKQSSICIDDNFDPLPAGTDIKFRQSTEQLMQLNVDFFDAEVKVEVNDLELLPQVEIIEDIIPTTEPIKCEGSVHIENDENLKTDVQVNVAPVSTVKPIKRRRGRPRKCALPMSPVKRENISDAEIDNNNSSDTYTTDSEESLSEVVEKKERDVTNKQKCRKRSKSHLLSHRVTREELARKKAQHSEYDRVIAQFFEQFACPKCNLIIQNFSALRKHFRSVHEDDPSYMSCCGRKFFQRKALAEHVYLHWNPDHFKCESCARTFQDARALEVHEQTHVKNTNNATTINKDKKIFQCDKCPRHFTTKAAFEYHNFSKHVPRSEFKYSCIECNKKLPTERKLKDHMRYMHDPESAIICDKCGKQMRSQSNLKKHHQTEHSDVPRPTPVPMQCEICGTWLRHLSGLKQHMKTIHEDTGGEHRCHICNKTSTNARALKRHIYHNHECERKFKCTMCEKAFKRPQDLREHTSTHTGEVLYTCPNCPMTFFSNANMYKHRQRLHRAEYEADRKKPRPPNIMQQAVGATAAMKMQQAVGATSAFFARSNERKT